MTATALKNQTAAQTLSPPGLSLASDDEARQILASMSVFEMLSAAIALQDEISKDGRFTLVGEGGTRVVYREGKSNSVFKLPNISEFIIEDSEVEEILMCNFLEAAYYEQSAFYGWSVMPCKLVFTTTGVPVLVMEYSDMKANDDLRPVRPVTDVVDGNQVAWSALLGLWAAFDATCPTRDSAAYEELGMEDGMRADYSRLVGNIFPALYSAAANPSS